MNDFLSHLVERSLGAAEAIQPRPVSRFDSDGPAPEPMPLETPAPMTTPAAHPPQAIHPLHAPLAEAPRVQPTSMRLATPAIVVTRPTEDGAPRSIQPPIESLQLPARSEPPTSSVNTMTEKLTLTRETVIQHKTFIERLVERERILAEAPMKRDDARPSASAVAPVSPMLPALREAILPARRAQVSDKPGGRVIQPRVTIAPPMIPSSPTSTMSAPAEAEAPIIHVTIGRIEVRATPAPVRAAPARPANSGLSLEDYLRGREAGAR